MSVFSLSNIIQLLEKAGENGVSVSYSGEELSVHIQKGKQIDSSLLEELKSNKPFLINYFKNFANKRQESDVPAIDKIDRSYITEFPLSFSQERLWFIHQKEGTLQYHLPTVLRLKGKLNVETLVHAIQNIINRHEVLRTVIIEKDGRGYQQIKPKDEWRLNIVDGSGYKDDNELFRQFVRQLVNEPFDLSNDYMLRAHLVDMDIDDHVLVVTMHHIASDAWSQSVLVKEVLEFYTSFIDNRPDELPPLEIQYADYANWQRSYLHGDILAQKLEYWKNKLDGTETLQLPTDYTRPTVQTYKGGDVYFAIDTKLSEQLRTLSKQQGATLFITLLAVYKALLYRYSGQHDISVGTSFARREQHELENLIGLFVNTLALRDEINPEASFIELLQQVKTTTLGAYENQDIPFEKIVETVVKERTQGRNPLFQVMLVFANTPEVSELRLPGLELSKEAYEQNTTKFEITFFITETVDGLKGSVQYSTDLYRKETIEQMVSHFKTLLNSALKTPQEKVGRLVMLDSVETGMLLEKFNDSSVAYPKDQSVINVFEGQVMQFPEKTALVFDGQQLSYKELNKRANQLANYLRSKGVREGMLVPVYLNRGLEMMIAIMAIMKAGAAYVPVDSDFPEERIKHILDDTGASIIITEKSNSLKIEQPVSVEIIEIDYDWSQISKSGDENLNLEVKPNNLAYVIYTSGSTGKPKGVMIEHSSLLDYFAGLAQRVQIDKCESFALVSTLATDLGNTVIYGALLSGGALHIFSKESVSSIEFLHNYFHQNKIDCLKIVPSHWNALSKDEALLLPERLLIFGGEALPAKYIDNIRASGASCKVINHYGPTETTIGKLLHQVENNRAYQNTIPIGRPFSNTKVYVLNREQQLCPAGVPGQLYIAGDGVARGYWNKQALTKEKFIKDPFQDSNFTNGKWMYATGDLVKWLPDGSISFIGRVDDQVKIRGYRVEPGEIENILQQSEFVNKAIVIAKDDKQGNTTLVGYIIPEGAFDRTNIVSYLKDTLPEYMVPSALVELESLPLTANGKVDKRALPDPEIELPGDEYVAARNETEQRLAEIWQEVLELDRVGIHDDFFELGGHSLLAIRLVSAIRKIFAVEMPIGDIFDYPTVALLSVQIEKNVEAVVPPIVPVKQKPERIPLSFSQERLWFIDQLEGSVQYHIPAILRLKGQLNAEVLSYAFQQIINRHEILRTVMCEDEGQGYQYINDKDQWKLNSIDGSSYKEDAKGLNEHIRHLVNRRFDLTKDHMLRADLLRLSDEEYVLVITLHHIASDGWSASIIVKEIVELCNAFITGREAQLINLPLQYADFAIWQRSYLQGDVLLKKLSFWRENLQGVEPLELPTDFARPIIQSTKGAFTRFYIDNEIAEGVKQLSQKEGTSLFMTLLAVFKVLLFRYSGQHDICVGTPIAGRQQQELEGLIGFFVNTLALRTELSDSISFKELLQQIRSNTLKAYEHQEVPFEKVVEAVVKERELSRSPLFQVMFILQNTPSVDEFRLGDIELIHEATDHDTSKFELTFSITESPNGLNGAVEYCSDLFCAETIQKMIAHFKTLLNAVFKTPSKKIAMLPMVSQAEEQQLLIQFNNTDIVYPKEKSITRLFEEQVIKTPGVTAVVFEKEEINYQELNERSNQLAHYLRSKGIRANTLVPVCIERSIEMIISVIAILKAGAAYVPVDPDYPLERITYMIEDIQAQLIISGKASKINIIDNGNFQILEIDSHWNEIAQYPKNNPESNYLPDHLAYMLYTSGSTGRPKGVKMPGGALVNLLTWQEKQFTVKKRRVIQFASLNFDVSFQEIFSTLCFGSALYLINAARRKDMAELLNDIVNYKITHLFAPYIVLKNLAGQVSSVSEISFWLEEVITAGEQLKITRDIEEMLRKHAGRVVNQYGPTEAHVVSSFSMNSGDTFPAVPPIGKPIDNTRLYILNTSRQLVPAGVAGELYIGGVQVAQGYLNQPEQTAEKFIKDFFNVSRDATLYKTGDIARWLPDGNIEYLGRVDDQVKIRGYRIELGEIESVLMESDLVHQAVVLAKNDVNNNKRLVSYIVPEGEFRKDEIISHAKSNLPDYMVPSLWMEMEKLPVTRNGKIDRKALPNPDASELVGNAFVPPRNKLENALAEIWMRLLGIEKVGIHDNFFELGGHSLLATRVVSAIRKQLEVELAIKDLFVHPNIAELALRLKDQAKALLQPEIKPQVRPEYIPLSFSQERLWFLDRMEGTLQYHLPAVLKLKGNLNRDALANAFRQIINRHEVLRTVIREIDGEGYQHIKEQNNSELIFLDGYGYNHDVDALTKNIQQLINTPFDLSKDDMIRAHLIELGEDNYVLVVTTHHIASDGWSISVLVNEVVEFYNAYENSRSPNLEPLAIQYADFAIWQREYLKGDILNKKMSFWKNKLHGVPPLELPLDYPRPATQSTRGTVAGFNIHKELTGKLNTLSRKEGATMFMTLLSAFNVLLYRYSGQEDICVGTPIAGRSQQEVESLMGFFINSLALRSDLSKNISFKELLQQVKDTTLGAYEHQDVPFEKVVEAVVKDRDIRRSPLFQVMFMFQNTPDVPALKLGDVELSREKSEHKTSKFELTFTLTENADGLNGSVEYCTDLYSEQTIQRMIGHFKELLSSIVSAPEEAINNLTVLSSSEQQQLLTGFNDTELAYPKDKSIIHLFEEQVVKTPGSVALVFEEKQLSYTELNAKANQLAYYLIEKGVTPAGLVPICIERSMEMVIGLLAILKTGAAYVPVDPEYPEERISYMLEDTNANLILTTSQSRDKIKVGKEITIIETDSEAQRINEHPDYNLRVNIHPNDLAYVIYTSGSTGKPKGVMIEHRSVVNLLMSFANTIEFTSDSVFLSVTTYSFDIAYLELYMPLIHGAKLIVSSREVSLNGFLLTEKIASYRPTHMQATPSTWQILLDCEWENKEGIKMLIGGEAVKEDLKNELTQMGEVFNCYGPTETTIWSLVKKLSPVEKVLIGKPIANTNIAILNKENQLCPVGAAGEICIGGDGLARGYLNRPELTTEKFFINPFAKNKETRLYKTGDLGRWLPDGNIEYMGRLDDQVKIRGHRIEPGEIESLLQQCGHVSQAVVLARDDKQGNKRLVGYIVPQGSFEKESIIIYLRGKLPAYMIPALWVELQNLPLTPNGKINRKALPDPEISGSEDNYVRPGNEMEKMLVEIWQNLLGVERIGIKDNFFELGGHSLLIIKMVSMIKKQFSVSIPVLLLFQFTTISDISKYMDWQNDTKQEEDSVPFEVLSI